MVMPAYQTIITGPNVITQTTQSILYQLQWIPSIKAPSLWIVDQVSRAAAVQRARLYEQGDQDLSMSPEMMNLLGIRSATYSPFASNRQMAIVQTMVDRCVLQTVQASGNPSATQWASDVWEYARLDALSGDVHEATVRDGDCFLLTTWDENLQQLRFTLEEAYDGTQGMLAFYRSKVVPIMDCAIKLWQIALDISQNILTRVNLYFPDHVEKYYAINQAPLAPWQGGDISIPQYNPQNQKYRDFIIRGGARNGKRLDYSSIQAVSSPTPSAVIHFEQENSVQFYTARDGQPLGIPVIHFRNRGRQNYGRSEIKSSIPLQDAMNRVMYSLVINAEYNGFPLRWSRGFRAPSGLRPGTIIEISPDTPLPHDQVADMGQLNAADMTPFLKVLQWLTNEMGAVTRTPTPEFTGEGGRLSGEALKQLDIGLIGKANRFMTKAGNAWEDAFMMGYRIQEAYGDKLPPEGVKAFKSVWKSPEIRNDQVVVQNAIAGAPYTGKAEVLRGMAEVRGWNEDDIQRMLDEQQQDTVNQLAALSSVPGFTQFAEPGAQMQAGGTPQPNEPEMQVQPSGNEDLSGQVESEQPEGEQERTAE